MLAKGKVKQRFLCCFFFPYKGHSYSYFFYVTMEVNLNHQNFIVPDQCSIHLLLADVLRHPAQGLAIAINENIVPKSQWESHILRSGDKIVLIKATQGG